MTCKELVELVTDYLEGALPQSQRVRFEEHVAVCESCRLYVAQLRTTVSLVGRLREEDVPEHMRDDLVAAFRGWASDHPGEPAGGR
ncbi:MAG: zf-HC2 domain-containing protein [Actinomycetota bacterium]|nr:zf-HC2 domain-containing protein [Actinomycetota bacterium]MDQ5808931.1 zf-HC2 domain-containing protein [Actinomycetota bacterium]